MVAELATNVQMTWNLVQQPIGFAKSIGFVFPIYPEFLLVSVYKMYHKRVPRKISFCHENNEWLKTWNWFTSVNVHCVNDISIFFFLTNTFLTNTSGI